MIVMSNEIFNHSAEEGLDERKDELMGSNNCAKWHFDNILTWKDSQSQQNTNSGIHPGYLLGGVYNVKYDWKLDDECRGEVWVLTLKFAWYLNGNLTQRGKSRVIGSKFIISTRLTPDGLNWMKTGQPMTSGTHKVHLRCVYSISMYRMLYMLR